MKFFQSNHGYFYKQLGTGQKIRISAAEYQKHLKKKTLNKKKPPLKKNVSRTQKGGVQIIQQEDGTNISNTTAAGTPLTANKYNLGIEKEWVGNIKTNSNMYLKHLKNDTDLPATQLKKSTESIYSLDVFKDFSEILHKPYNYRRQVTNGVQATATEVLPKIQYKFGEIAYNILAFEYYKSCYQKTADPKKKMMYQVKIKFLMEMAETNDDIHKLRENINTILSNDANVGGAGPTLLATLIHASTSDGTSTAYDNAALTTAITDTKANLAITALNVPDEIWVMITAAATSAVGTTIDTTTMVVTDAGGNIEKRDLLIALMYPDDIHTVYEKIIVGDDRRTAITDVIPGDVAYLRGFNALKRYINDSAQEKIHLFNPEFYIDGAERRNSYFIFDTRFGPTKPDTSLLINSTDDNWMTKLEELTAVQGKTGTRAEREAGHKLSATVEPDPRSNGLPDVFIWPGVKILRPKYTKLLIHLLDCVVTRGNNKVLPDAVKTMLKEQLLVHDDIWNNTTEYEGFANRGRGFDLELGDLRETFDIIGFTMINDGPDAGGLANAATNTGTNPFDKTEFNNIVSKYYYFYPGRADFLMDAI